MDNLFDTLIILFMIFSFLSGLFKKKKSPKGTEKTVPTSEKKKEGKEILEDILGFKFPNNEQNETQSVGAEEPVYVDVSKNYNEEESWNPEEEFEDYEPEKEIYQNYSPNQYNSKVQSYVPDVYGKKSDDEFKEPLKSDSEKAYEKKYEKTVVNKIKSELKEISSLKNAIILSEILQKPKALRR